MGKTFLERWVPIDEKEHITLMKSYWLVSKIQNIPTRSNTRTYFSPYHTLGCCSFHAPCSRMVRQASDIPQVQFLLMTWSYLLPPSTLTLLKLPWLQESFQQISQVWYIQHFFPKISQLGNLHTVPYSHILCILAIDWCGRPDEESSRPENPVKLQ